MRKRPSTRSERTRSCAGRSQSAQKVVGAGDAVGAADGTVGAPDVAGLDADESDADEALGLWSRLSCPPRRLWLWSRRLWLRPRRHTRFVRLACAPSGWFLS